MSAQIKAGVSAVSLIELATETTCLRQCIYKTDGETYLVLDLRVGAREEEKLCDFSVTFNCSVYERNLLLLRFKINDDFNK